jgi:hypothetical protein
VASVTIMHLRSVFFFEDVMHVSVLLKKKCFDPSPSNQKRTGKKEKKRKPFWDFG